MRVIGILASVLFALLVGGPPLVAGAFFVKDALVQHDLAKLSERMVSVNGMIDRVEIKDSYWKGRAYPEVRAQYSYDYVGQRFKSDRLWLQVPSPAKSGNLHKSYAAELDGWRAAKTPVRVWIDPEQPSFATMDRSAPLSTAIWMFCGGLFFICLGGASFAVISYLLWNLRDAPLRSRK
jgi:Protein of unknown function (DUF3592)